MSRRDTWNIFRRLNKFSQIRVALLHPIVFPRSRNYASQLIASLARRMTFRVSRDVLEQCCSHSKRRISSHMRIEHGFIEVSNS